MKARTTAHSLQALAARALALLPHGVLAPLITRLAQQEPQLLYEALGPRLNRNLTLETMPFDLPVEGQVQFEHLAGLFASNSLNHGVISMPIRQAAYLFGLIRRLRPRQVIEIGRYKGGSTLVMAAAMAGHGELWSIDVGEKERRLAVGKHERTYDQQLMDWLGRLAVDANLLVGDSRTIELPVTEADVVLIDGDHSYEGVKSDFERFGRHVRLGGAVFFDDAFDEDLFGSHSDTVGRVVREVCAGGEFRLVRQVNRMAHLERVSPPRMETRSPQPTSANVTTQAPSEAPER